MKNSIIGLDLVDIVRFKNLKKGDAFLKKVFTDQEQNYCFTHKAPAPHLAGIFAAKEAALKALGANKYVFRDIEVRHTLSGQPEVWLKTKRNSRIRISISHTNVTAGAVAIIR